MSEDLRNWRSRRLEACRAADLFHNVIEALGDEDGSMLPPVGYDLPPAPSAMLKRELQNTTANLLRLVLLLNDGSISHQELRRF